MTKTFQDETDLDFRILVIGNCLIFVFCYQNKQKTPGVAAGVSPGLNAKAKMENII